MHEGYVFVLRAREAAVIAVAADVSARHAAAQRPAAVARRGAARLRGHAASGDVHQEGEQEQVQQEADFEEVPEDVRPPVHHALSCRALRRPRAAASQPRTNRVGSYVRCGLAVGMVAALDGCPDLALGPFESDVRVWRGHTLWMGHAADQPQEGGGVGGMRGWCSCSFDGGARLRQVARISVPGGWTGVHGRYVMALATKPREIRQCGGVSYVVCEAHVSGRRRVAQAAQPPHWVVRSWIARVQGAAQGHRLSPLAVSDSRY